MSVRSELYGRIHHRHLYHAQVALHNHLIATRINTQPTLYLRYLHSHNTPTLPYVYLNEPPWWCLCVAWFRAHGAPTAIRQDNCTRGYQRALTFDHVCMI
jgi:hypothetical protein